MKFYKKLLLTVMVCSVSFSASARVVTGKIADLITWQDGHTVIKIQGGPVNGCSSQYYYSLGIKGTDIKAEPMLSVALAAYLAGKTVTISTNDASCQGGEEKVAYLKVLP
jgi:hypothetical protein